MTKRIIALLLALILTVGLLPTVVLAAEPTAPTDDTPGEDAVSFTKKVVEKNGQDMIKIEAYVNGDVKTQITTTPCDIVLVLDQSGSMADPIKAPGYNYTAVSGEWSYNSVKNGTYYYYCNRCNDYHEVEAEWDYSGNWLYYYLIYDCPRNYSWSYDRLYNGRDWWRWDANETIYTGTLYTRTETAGSDKTKVEALKEAANTFLQVVSESATANNVAHRVSIVGFGRAQEFNTNGGGGNKPPYDPNPPQESKDSYENTEVLSVVGRNSSYTDENGNTQYIGQKYSTSLSGNTYKDSLVAINDANKNINTTLTNAVKAVAASGATAVELGLNMASKVFSNQDAATQTEYNEGKRAKIVVVVTDGIPTHNRGLETDVATAAIQTAGSLEKSGAKVFAVGIALDTVNEDGGGPGATPANAKKFISWVSSDYPNATSWDNSGAAITGAPKYGIEVGTADSLKRIFADIAKESTQVSANAKLTQTAVMSDTLSGYFNLPANADASSIEVYTSAASYGSDGKLTWKKETKYDAAQVTISSDKKTISVTNFDYTANCVTKKAKDAAGTDFGKKLVIYIPIEKDTTKAQFGGYLPTNADATLNDENGDNGDKGYKADGAHKDCIVVAPKLAGKTIEIDAGESATTTDLFKSITPNGTEWPDGNNNAGVDLEYTIKDEQGNTIATAEVPAGTSTVMWTFADGKTDANQYAEAGEYKFTIDCEATCKNKTAHEGSTANSVQATGTIKVKRTTATVTLTKTITGLTDEEATAVRTGLKIYAKDIENVGHELEKDATSDTYSAELAAGSYTIVETGKDVTGYDCTTTLANSQNLTFTVVADTDMSLTLTNAYTIKKYSISYEYEGTVPAGAQEKLPTTVNDVPFKSEQTVAPAPTLPGYSFVGWTSEQVTPDTEGKFTMPASNVVFKGSWTEKDKVTINYVVVGPDGCGTVSPTIETPYVDAASVSGSTAAASDGFHFVGWYDNPECSGTALSTDATYAPSKPEAGWADKTYYAKFESLTYTITFTTEEGGTLTGKTEHTGLAYNADFPDEPGKVANTGYYFDGWYKDGNKVASLPEKVTESATYTAKWKKFDPATLNLTNKFWKELTSDTETLPENANSFTLNIKNEKNQIVAQAHVIGVPLEQQSGKYTGTKVFAFESNMTFDAEGTYTYTVAEATGSISGMSYDKSSYSMTVVVDEDSTTGKLTITNATIEGGASDKVDLLATNGTNSITFHNEYIKPKKSINLGDLIQKDFDKKTDSEDLPTGSSYTFRVRVYERFKKDDGGYRYSDALYLGEVTMTEFGRKNFVFNYGVITFFEPGTHEYVVEEFNDGAENVDYDSNRYLLVLDVADDLTITARNAGSLNDEVSTQSVEQTPVITFFNKYNKEKDPNALYLDFSKYVQKELTATGSKTASDVNFTVDVKGMEFITVVQSGEGEEAVSTYAGEFEPRYSTTLYAKFDSITGGEVKTTQFTGSTVEIDQAGRYDFVLSEVDGQRSGVTYDDTVYTLSVNVIETDGKLVVSFVNIQKGAEYVADKTITFHNTIDTGKDDYYPIIIPTIINKDTGMLNKTDHYAYVIGYPDGTVHPNGQITRAEVATIFFRLLRDEVRDSAFTTSNSYSDVAYGKWYNNPISTMSALGIITGYPDGTFKPDKPITRAEFAAIAARFDETQSGKSATFSDVIGHWAAKEIGIAYYNDWIKGYPDGTFKPDQNITRAEAMTLINRVLERKPESPSDLLSDMNIWTDNMDTSKWYYLDVQEATNSHSYTRKTFNYELWRSMLPDPDWSRYER